MKYILPLSFFIVLVLNACSTPPKERIVWPAQQRVQAHIDLGMSYLQHGKFSIAKNSFNKALSINPKSSSAYHGLGLIEIKSLSYSKALKLLNKAVNLDEKNANAASDYALLLCKTRSAQQGINVLRNYQSKTTNVQKLNIKLAWGRCYQANQQPLPAESIYQNILAKNPSIREALLPMAQLKYSRQQYLLARGFLQRYFATNTTSPQALLLSAKVEHKLKNTKKRDQYTRQLWSRYPKSKHALVARELFGYHP